MKNFTGIAKAALCLLLMLPAIMQAQKTKEQFNEMRRVILKDQRVKSVVIDEERQSPSLIMMNPEAAAYKRTEAAPVLDKLLSTRKGTDLLIQDKQFTFANGMQELEFQQYYQGIKVDRAKMKAFMENDEVRFFSGSFYNIPEGLGIQPSLNKQQAIEFAKRRVNAVKYADEEIKERMKSYKSVAVIALLQQELADATPEPELVLVKDFTQNGPAVIRLAYKINIYAAMPVSRSWVYVDAANGNILLIDAIIKHVNEPSPNASTVTSVQTRYAGTRNIYVKQISGNDPQNGQLLNSSHPASENYTPGASTWILMDDTRGNGVETYDLNGIGGLPISVPPAYSAAKSFTDVDNNWTVAEHKRGVENGPGEAENDDIAWDAHWGAEVVYDYWKTDHNRLSYDGNNAKIKSFIHSGLAYDNAFWNGSVMTYGDGSGTAAMGFKPLTSLDVCGHEIGHGVCSSTSDLVYAGESGGMNEALSDIWASCIEFFAIKNIDPSLGTVYKPFYIGEQIAADPANPLRRMDKPKAQGNPDTYAGANWVTTDGCTPTLANDECGVHTNSGVLNKWFYLITVGSGAGSGPDAAFAGEDDGINDAVTTGPASGQHPANTYTVNGVGFSVSEQVTFITETLLSSTATYAEARQVSVAVATSMSGSQCSPLVETVTNAWYAVGVGSKFAAPCVTTYGFSSINTASVSETAPIIGCASSKQFDIPILLPPNSTATIVLGGTAVRSSDYFLLTTPITNNTSASVKKNIPVTILNDGTTEPDEFVTVTATVSNLGGNPVNSTFRLNIIDDDAVPVIGNTQKTLLAETFSRADGFADPTGWTEIIEMPETANGDPMAFGKNQWGIFGNKLAITGKDGITGMQLPAGNYNNLSESQTLIKTPQLDGRGLTGMTIKFDYSVQGEVDPAGTDPENFPALDYMAVAYSLDGINFIEMANGEFKQFASAVPASGTLTASLPAAVANKRFYLGFRWHNDANAGGPQSVSIDNLVVQGAPRKFENQLYHNSRNVITAGNDIYFISVQDGELVGRIKNNSSVVFDCTNMFIEKTGTSVFNLYTTPTNVIKASDKVVRINPLNNGTGSVILTLYYTEQQLKALELASGANRSTFSFYRVNASGYTGAANTNTTAYTTVYSSAGTVGGFFTFTGTAQISGSFTLGASVPLVPPSPRPFIAANKFESGQRDFSNGYPNPVKGTFTMMIDAPVNQKVSLSVSDLAGKIMQAQTLQFTKGSNKVNADMHRLIAGAYILQIRDEKGTLLRREQLIKEYHIIENAEGRMEKPSGLFLKFSYKPGRRSTFSLNI